MSLAPDGSAAFPLLFSPLSIRHLQLHNRIVLAAHGKAYSTDGLPGERMAAYYAERARGGVGLIVTEATVVHPTGRHRSGVIRGFDPACVPGYARIAERVHAHGVPIVGQMFHPGAIASGQHSLLPVWSSSPTLTGSNEYTHAVRPEEIRELVESFGTTAGYFKAAGYDGVEVHAGHGYLIHQFLSPALNTRADAYGGTPERRLRMCLEVVERVRDVVGPDFVVGVRLSSDDFLPGGLGPEGVAEVAQRLEATGMIDYVSITAGSRSTYWAVVPPMDMPPAAFTHLAGQIRAGLRLPVVAVGRINDPVVGERVLAAGQADLVAMVRALITDPELPLKARTGRVDEIRHCIACLQACRGAPIGKAVTCIANPAAGEEEQLGPATWRPAERPRRVLVIGGGPAGMEAARVAAERGHAVTLWEAHDVLGGQVNLAVLGPYRSEVGEVTRWQAAMLARRGVEVRLGCRATAADVLAFAPDAVVVATGSRPQRPAVAGADSPHVVDHWAALSGGAPIGQRVVVVDGGENFWPQCSTAELLASQGKQVELVSPAMSVGAEINVGFIPLLYRRFRQLSVRLTPQTRLAGIEDGSVTLADVFSGETRRVDGVDTVVLATGNAPQDGLFADLQGRVPELHLIGDAVAPRRLDAAIREGLLVGRAL